MTYSIASHPIHVTGTRLDAALSQLTGFSVFLADTDPDGPVLHFAEADAPLPLFDKPLYTNQVDAIVSSFGTALGGGYRFDMTPPHAQPLQLHIDPADRTARFLGNYDPRLLRFACWIAFGALTAQLHTVAFHTSAILHRGRVVFFLGESGTGKSTHTRLWRENIPGATLLNDDSPIVRIIDGAPVVFGSPWSGKTPCYRQEHYPLAACVRLSQAPHNHITRLNVIQGYAALHPSCPPAFAYDETLYDPISHILSTILTTTPIYHLQCLPDPAAAHLSHTTIFPDE